MFEIPLGSEIFIDYADDADTVTGTWELFWVSLSVARDVTGTKTRVAPVRTVVFVEALPVLKDVAEVAPTCLWKSRVTKTNTDCPEIKTQTTFFRR